jgi:flagellar assembly protein FliH
MSNERVIPSDLARDKTVEAFPYFPVDPSLVLESSGAGDDDPIGAKLSTPEEEAQRLASVDHIIHTRMQEAERHAQDIARQAYEEGFASGESEGRAFGESQYRSYMQRLDEHFAYLDMLGTRFEQAVRDEILALALAIGEYLAGQRLGSAGSSLEELLQQILLSHPLRRAAASAERGSALTVHMNPMDLELAGDRFSGYVGIHFMPDPELGRGSLRVESEEGVLEATLEQRRERLLELLHRQREEG